jgi:hypothetical protein
VLRYPEAISFAPGSPSDRFFDAEASLGAAAAWVGSRARETGTPERAVWNDLGQYNKTNGIINGLISRPTRDRRCPEVDRRHHRLPGGGWRSSCWG